MTVIENIVWLLVLIGVMIFVHELGHYWAARFFDVRVDVFSFGFGPRLFGFKRGETDFRFSAVLFGGFVKMAGEQPTDADVNDPRAFLAKPRWQRLLIAFSGPAMNIVLAVALVTGVFMVRYPKMPDSVEEGMVGYVTPGSPAAKAGIHEGDRIVTIEGIQNPSWDDIAMREASAGDHPLQVRIRRNASEFWVVVTPALNPHTGAGSAGWQAQGEVEIADVSQGMPAEKFGLRKGDVLLRGNGQPLRSLHRLQEIIERTGGKPVEIDYVRQGQPNRVAVQPMFAKQDGPSRWMIGVFLQHHMIVVQLPLPEALRESLQQNAKSATLIYQFLRGVIERRMSPKAISGPIGIAQLSGDAAREGPMVFIGLMAMVSLNLAIFNLLPIPILDGGVIVMLLIEMVMRRDLSLRFKEMVFKLGFVFLMAIMAFVIYNDISKILPG